MRADARGLPAALRRWSAEPVAAAHVTLDGLPDATTRAWLAALDAARTRVTWQPARAPALAASAEWVTDPAGGVRVDAIVAGAGANPAAVAPSRAASTVPLVVRDTIGPLDSVQAAGRGATFQLANAGPALAVRAPGAIARLSAGESPPPLGVVYLLARAGWEGKFTAAALQERGWTVRTRFALGPGVAVTSAAGTPRLDTGVVAAVVALDSSAAALAPSITRYVRSGGGLILAGEAALAPALAPLAPATPALTPVDDSLGALRPLQRPRADAVPLATRRVAGTQVLVAAGRRIGAGRVVQIADEATWHRRLRPDPAAPAAHRAWWAQVIAAAAYRGAPVPDSPRADRSAFAPPPTDPAPLAATVAALGPPSTPASTPATAPPLSAPSTVPDTLLIPLALTALVAEVASRRLRGAV